MRLFYRGDLDGFFGLAIDNLVQLLLIEELCKRVLGFPEDLLYGRVLPGAAVSLLVGNLFYAWQAHRLAARTGLADGAGRVPWLGRDRAGWVVRRRAGPPGDAARRPAVDPRRDRPWFHFRRL